MTTIKIKEAEKLGYEAAKNNIKRFPGLCSGYNDLIKGMDVCREGTNITKAWQDGYTNYLLEQGRVYLKNIRANAN